MSANSLGSESVLHVGEETYAIYRLSSVEKLYPDIQRLPFSLKILLENLLRMEDGLAVTPAHIESVARWSPYSEPHVEVAFTPSRVILQDFSGVPVLVDLAAMRTAMHKMGGDPTRINPIQPAELIVDHSVQVDDFGTSESFQINSELEFRRNQERYHFLKWGQLAFQNFQVVPPGMGIVHQVNLEHLARVVFTKHRVGTIPFAYPDTLLGTDSHTTMINGLGILGWGVGGIEAEAAMLGQPVSMLLPQVVGVKLTGSLPLGTTATDLVLTLTQKLRQKGVVGKFIEFFGEGLSSLSVADRATVANMAPEYGATCGLFPIDQETLRYLEFSGRPPQLVRLVEAYSKEQGLFQTKHTSPVVYSDVFELELGAVEASLAGPTRPQDRVPLGEVARSFTYFMRDLSQRSKASASVQPVPPPKQEVRSLIRDEGQPSQEPILKLPDGAVVIAAITSCTNTSNPSVMIGAGILAKKAVERGLRTKPWVKTSLAPGSQVVTNYLNAMGLTPALEKLGFYLVGYGCTTCIGNSGPLSLGVSRCIHEQDSVVAAVLSGNRNFEGRIHPEVRLNYLASPPLVVAYALAGRVDLDLTQEPIGKDEQGKAVFLKEIWPTPEEIEHHIRQGFHSSSFKKVYAHVIEGDQRWNELSIPSGDLFEWNGSSTYVRHPPYFAKMSADPDPVRSIQGARVLVVLGDCITTDHISPAGSIKSTSPAGRYLQQQGVEPQDFNSYGSRRGNHEVMVRGTFANVRLRNQLVPGVEGGMTRYLPTGEVLSIYDAAMRYAETSTPLLIIAGKEYGSGSSRDWAAKGPHLLGVRFVIAESYERIHRSNLVGMGILPLQFKAGENFSSLDLTGEELYSVDGLKEVLDGASSHGRQVIIRARREGVGNEVREFQVDVRIDTPQEILYYKHGGILLYALRQLLARDSVRS
ncbi:aconitate hydratase AcnA [Pajaroellobacter abortibovis]|uniref:Aconitate hydratase n=1 Tax=Pajaroellobacter abortibovis TaxID=1882918 RepID=A0A1L6MWE4_9BACT|nr:aconitate hydratase AcnA [Pajaroellobacter abortibovis]APR99870.1 aconitate hydratase 1 [Pajaroellobacter abortibovis]